jgi:hypothetical protein
MSLRYTFILPYPTGGVNATFTPGVTIFRLPADLDPEMDPGQPTSEWLPLREAALKLGRAERTLRFWLDAGKITGRKVEERGCLRWEVWTGADPPPDPGCLFFSPAIEKETPALVPAPEVPTISEALQLVREQFVALREENQALRRENQEACHRIGWLEAQVREKLPALEAGRDETRAEVVSVREEVRRLEAAGANDRAWIRGRMRAAAAALVMLAVLLAAVGGWVLTRASGAGAAASGAGLRRSRTAVSASSPPPALRLPAHSSRRLPEGSGRRAPALPVSSGP